jgi:hypothetical protein
MRMAQAVPALMGLAVLAACSKAGGGARWSGTVTDSAGVQVVHNPAEGTWRPEDQWSVVEALRIGAAEGEPEYQFGMLGSMTVTRDGRIVAADVQAQHLKVFSPTGTYERTIGKPGSGPGELALGIAAVSIGTGDTLLVADWGNQRVNAYLLDGTFVSSARIDIQQGLPLRWEGTKDGRMAVQLRQVQFPNMPAPKDSSDAIVVRRTDGSITDTLLKVPSGKTFDLGGQRPQVKLFSVEPAWAMYGDDGVIYGVSHTYRFGMYAAGGSLRRLIEKPFTPTDITQADQDQMMTALEKMWKQFGLTQEQVAGAKQVIAFADRYPAYFQLLEGTDGSVWVQRIQSPSDLPPELQESYNPGLDMGSAAWDVFDAEGRYLGVVTMPVRFQPVRFVGDRIYGIQRDELDVQYIVVLNVVKGGTAP